MFENITLSKEKNVVITDRHRYFDEYAYKELRGFICGGRVARDGVLPSETSALPLFEEVSDKINSLMAEQGLPLNVLVETMELLLYELVKPQRDIQFLLSYLARETVGKSVLRAFNNKLGCKCVDIQSLSYRIGDNISEARKVFQSLRICDPAAGCGDLLHLILDEMIAVKSQLGILTDRNGNPLYQYKFVAGENGLTALEKKEFRVIDLDGDTNECRRIREALFVEKVNILRNNLFGVEAEPLAVLLCKLRLWLDVIGILGDAKLKKLPVIESNIVCGDALVSRFTMKDDLMVALKNINHTVVDYKRLVENHKTNEDALERHYIVEMLNLIRNRLIEGIGWYSRDTDELLKLRRELSNLGTPGLFPLTDKEEEALNGRLLQLKAKIIKQEKQLATFRHHPAFAHAVEWRYIFPELLDDKGEFTGFDAIASILPDATLSALGSDKSSLYKRMNYKVYKRSANISELYCELANRLTVYGGYAVFLMSATWHIDPANSALGEYLAGEMNPLQLIMIDKSSPLFGLMKDKSAMVIQKDINRHQTMVCRIDSLFDHKAIDIEAYVQQYSMPVISLVEKGASKSGAAEPFMTPSSVEYMSINGKINRLGLKIKHWDVRVFSGVMSGCDEAFVLNRAVRDELIHADIKNSDIIRPLLMGDFIRSYGDDTPERWLLYIPWHFPLQYDKTINAASSRAEQRFQIQYPEIYNHLQKYKEPLSSRNAIEVGLGFEWYALQRSSGLNNNWNDFAEQKIVWKRDSTDYSFGIDYGGCVVLEDTCYMTGQHLKFLLGVLNSTMGRFMMKDIYRMFSDESKAGVSLIESLPVPVPGGKMETDIITLVNRRITENGKSDDDKRFTESKINRLVYDLYELTDDERAFILSQEL
ncbi:MAG: hypothetical protein LBT35_00225 [Tannerella sp.]|jgi:hypothetical protein|nr:hypothetical protein [Tannerella sp.]